MYFHVQLEGEIVSTELIVLNDDRTCFVGGGTRRQHLRTPANLLLKHTIVEWSRQQGYRYYLLGSGNSEEDSPFKYKRAFRARGEGGPAFRAGQFHPRLSCTKRW
jgi:hypothetical protein